MNNKCKHKTKKKKNGYWKSCKLKKFFSLYFHDIGGHGTVSLPVLTLHYLSLIIFFFCRVIVPHVFIPFYNKRHKKKIIFKKFEVFHYYNNMNVVCVCLFLTINIIRSMIIIMKKAKSESCCFPLFFSCVFCP